MAEREAISAKLKLVVGFKDENMKDKTRQLSFAGLKTGVEADKLTAVATALAGLQPDTLTRIVETVENEITA
jgi:hypothetical protein